MKETFIEKIARVKREYSTGVVIIAIICAIAWCFGVMCLQAWLVMLLWNWVAVGLFGAPVLSFWVAFGLYWLCSLLFKRATTADKKSE